MIALRPVFDAEAKASVTANRRNLVKKLKIRLSMRFDNEEETNREAESQPPYLLKEYEEYCQQHN